MFVLTGGFFFAELIVGIIAQSIALQADAMHMLSDVLALAIGFAALLMSNKASTLSHTFGFARMEIIGALINSTYLLATCISIVFEAVERFRHLEEVSPSTPRPSPHLSLVILAPSPLTLHPLA